MGTFDKSMQEYGSHKAINQFVKVYMCSKTNVCMCAFFFWA